MNLLFWHYYFIQCVLVLQLLWCQAVCVLKLFVYVRVCANCVLHVCVALSYFI